MEQQQQEDGKYKEEYLRAIWSRYEKSSCFKYHQVNWAHWSLFCTNLKKKKFVGISVPQKIKAVSSENFDIPINKRFWQ